ncbi:macoilin [Salvelinus namaycush]|uniref:Macoilin n=1 Tax=Salvelinus namaycush TaxID=8040 RepID=A0A8U0TQW9_SALNM|nr:macoilin [Salvelinus namaycush]
MKKRYVDASKLRKMKKIKITEEISESAYTFLKFMIVWTLVLLADFILEFRLEYLWPCWLFFRSVYTTFHCHGLVICVVFVCAAFTLDIFCFIFVPLHWLFFAASTYVLFNYIWHTEKGICMSTVSLWVSLWVMLVYTDASLRLKDLNNSHANLSHLFAAHWLEQEMRRLKGELQASRQGEQELRSHVCNLTNSEHSLRPEVSLLRQNNELLQSKILSLTKTKQKDKQISAVLEKKTRAETEARLSIEKQLAELQAQKLEEAAILARSSLPNRQEHSVTLMLRKKEKDLETEYKQLQLESQGKEGRLIALVNEVEALGKYRCVEQEEQDVLLSALSALQDKAQHLEYNLSAETRIKLDLFSALGDTRRQLEITQGKVLKQDKEIGEMKRKIAEVMAVSPGMSFMTPRPAVPQYLTKFLNSERYVLNPRALMYQCLKK